MKEKDRMDEHPSYVNRWKAVAPLLEKERRERIRIADTARFVRVTSGILAARIKDLPSRLESGLVEQQRFFRKVPPRSS
jgi:hypothetical protein